MFLAKDFLAVLLERFLVKIASVLLFAFGFLGAFCAQALQSTSLLPVGVNSPSFRMGHIQGIDERYVENGTLVKLGDHKSVIFDAPTLAKFNQDAKKLITALNRFGSQNLGDQFNLGVLKIETLPQVKYFAPVYARGVTSNWTLGFGVPVVSYTNKIQLSQQFSNIDFYRQQFGGLDPELDEALNTNLGAATNQSLKDKGYQALENKDENFMGDVQLVSLYRLLEDKDQALVYQTQLNLPTGPKYNADDLAALNVFGRSNVNSSIIYSRKLGMGFTAVPYVSYMLNIQDEITVRVPTNEDDTLPDASSKESVKRTIGNTSIVGSNLFFEFNDSLTVGGGYEFSQKEKDAYRGAKNSRYDLVSANTALKAQRAKMEVSYSTVKSYFRKAALIPLILAFEVSDVVAGTNVERQLVQEFNLMLFF